MLETGKKFWMLHMRFHMLDDVTGCLIGLSSLVRLMRCGVKPSQSKMGFPQLGRVANRLGQGQGLPKPALGFIPLPTRNGDIAL